MRRSTTRAMSPMSTANHSVARRVSTVAATAHAGRIAESSMEYASGYGSRYLPDAARFDQGAADSMIHMPMAVAALAQIVDWQVPQIAETLKPLVDRVADGAVARGWQVPPEAHRACHMIGIRPDHLPEELIARLRLDRVFVSLRGGAIRVSPHLFNDTKDIDRLFDSLDRLI